MPNSFNSLSLLNGKREKRIKKNKNEKDRNGQIRGGYNDAGR